MTFHTWTTKGVSQHNSKEGEKLILLLLLIWFIFVLQIHNCAVYIYLIYDCGHVVAQAPPAMMLGRPYFKQSSI